jgi:predicted dehydrogenase
MNINRKIRMGMVGGGRGAFIGGVHRMAAALDGKIELIAGCFSADPKKSKASGEDLNLDPPRVYTTYEQMAVREAALPADERIDFVSIVTRNNTHFAVAKYFLEHGFHVVCEKPLAFNLHQAKMLRSVVRHTGKIFALTHNYTGYPMVKEARKMVQSNKLGRILKVVTEYPQGYALSALSDKARRIANWRLDPKVSGASNCIGDIGIHAENLVRYITGLEIDSLCAEVSTFIPGRPLDDDANFLIRFTSGAKGILYASQISCGEENNLSIRVYGTKGSLAWYQEHPNDLKFTPAGEPARIIRRGNDYVSEVAKKFTRLPFGHPEAFIEAFANVYLEVAAAIHARVEGKRAATYDFPTVDDGVHGMAFIETAVKSAKSNSKWTRFIPT